MPVETLVKPRLVIKFVHAGLFMHLELHILAIYYRYSFLVIVLPFMLYILVTYNSIQIHLWHSLFSFKMHTHGHSVSFISNICINAVMCTKFYI
jgi:hypothetical protein